MKALQIIAITTICFLSIESASAKTPGAVNHNKSDKKAKSNEEAHWVKGATMDNFILPVNPMQKPVKAPLV